MRRYFLVGALLLPQTALSCDTLSEACLIGEADAPVWWEFDTASGKTLGNGTGPVCIRNDLVFAPDGTIGFHTADEARDDCGTPPNAWKIVEIDGKRRLALLFNGQPCDYAAKLEGTNPVTLELATRCGQQPGQPIRLRFFRHEGAAP